MGSARRHHHMMHEARKSTMSPPCMLCGKTFKHLSTLKDHLRKAHSIYQSQYMEMYLKNC